jgi:hypothetical protein
MEQDRVMALEERIAQLEQRQRGGGPSRSTAETAFWAIMHNVFPDDARKHLKAAGRQQLLAARVYLDNWIQRLDESAEAPVEDSESPPAETIEVK